MDWHALNVDLLAKEVGVVPSAIYRHYDSKDAVLDLISQRLQANVQAVRQEVTEPMESLQCLMARHIQLVCENRGMPRVVFSEEIIGGQKARRQRLYQVIRDYLDKVVEMIREGQTLGRITANLPAETLSVMFLGLVQPAAILHLMSEGEFDATQFRHEAWGIFSKCSEPETGRPRRQKSMEPNEVTNQQHHRIKTGTEYEKQITTRARG